MKHNFTLGKLNTNYNDAFISRIKYLKSKKSLYKIKLNNNINILSSNQIIKPVIKTYFHSFKNINNINNINNYNKKRFTYSKSSIKNLDIPYKLKKVKNQFKENSLNIKKIKAYSHIREKSLFSDDTNTDQNLKKSFTFRKLRYNPIDNLKSKINNNNDLHIFYAKENFILMKSFNNIDNQIRNNINKIIIKTKKQILHDSELKEKTFYTNTDNNKNDININEIKINKNNKKFKNKFNFKNIKSKKFLNERKKTSESEISIKNKKMFNCINSKISFPFYIEDNLIMDNFSKENILEYKKYIETH